MPTPATAKWPQPKGDEEFEDMVLDALRVRWQDPNVHRYGRKGQRQYGIDILGKPTGLVAQLTAAQCKNTDSPSLELLQRELLKASTFQEQLGRYVFVVSARRDARLQDEVRRLSAAREGAGLFPVSILFYEDVCQDLATDPVLVAKHFPGWHPAVGAYAVQQAAGPRRHGLHPCLHAIAPPDPDFVGRKQVLEDINSWHRTGQVKVAALVGLGGAGKSSIARKWFDQLREHLPPEPPKLFWWGFYQNPSLGECVDHLLGYLSDGVVTAREVPGPIDKLSRLKLGLHQENCVVVLDGFEAVQITSTGEGGQDSRRSARSYLREFLQGFAEAAGSVFLLVTSRYGLDELRGYLGTQYRTLDVAGLSAADAATLFVKARINAEEHEIESVWQLFEGHALSLRLLVTLLQEYYEGDIHAVQEIPALTSEGIAAYGADDIDGGKARRILVWYDHRLNEAERNFLKILSVFAKPVDQIDLSSVFRNQSLLAGNDDLAGLSDIGFANIIRKLSRLHLVTVIQESAGALYETHPLIKEYFSSLLGATAPLWHRALVGYYESRSYENDLGSVLRDRQIIHHSLRSRNYRAAIDASRRLLPFLNAAAVPNGTIGLIRPYPVVALPFAGTSYREVYKKAQARYTELRGGEGHKIDIRSAYFDNEDIDFDYFWNRLSNLAAPERVRRVRLLPCAIELIRNSKLEPFSNYNPNRPNEVIHRFAGLTRGTELFFVQVMENTETGEKYFMSAFPDRSGAPAARGASDQPA